jgi:hypothetical protein
VNRPDNELMSHVAAMQMSRRTDDRHRDIDATLRARVMEWLSYRGAGEHLIELVRCGGSLDKNERGVVYGESMPIGLRINK